MRSVIDSLKKEGYNLTVFEPIGGPIEDELKLLINADLSNPDFRQTFFRLIHNDPTFILTKVADGNYGKYGDGYAYRKRILSLKDDEIPRTVDELESFVPTDSMPPEMTIALVMALDSFNLNFSGYVSDQREYQLFGDSKGMDMLIKAKFAGDNKFEAADKGISQAVAFAMLERMIPNSALERKSAIDIVRYRNKMHKERERFKEHVLQITAELQELSGDEKQKRVFEIINKYLVPEARSFQEAADKNWDTLFGESIKAVIYKADDLARQIATVLPLSVTMAMLTAAAGIGKTLVPHIVDYYTKKKQIDRTNPYAYLMKLH